MAIKIPQPDYVVIVTGASVWRKEHVVVRNENKLIEKAFARVKDAFPNDLVRVMPATSEDFQRFMRDEL